MIPRGTALLLLWSALFVAGGACNGQTSSSGNGSETNWLECATDADCAGGACLCGQCATPCSATEPCPGDATSVTCAERGSPALSAVCGDSENPPAGLCVTRCTRDADCVAGLMCTSGVCVPERIVVSDVGAACVSQDEDRVDFPGYRETEINVESRTSQCATRLCLSYYFRGRASCPYGQVAGNQGCTTPSGASVTVPVEAQLSKRRATDAVYCSCRCDGEGPGPYCACPEGFVCAPVVPDLGLGAGQFAGSYCVKAGTDVTDPSTLAITAGPPCSEARHDCDPP